jgi:hypothetical protein
MWNGHWLKRPRQARTLPIEVFTSLVASLFDDPRSLVVGSIAASRR